MPRVEEKSINSKSRGNNKAAKKIGRKNAHNNKQSQKNRVVGRRKRNYSPEYYQRGVQIVYYSDEHKPVMEQQEETNQNYDCLINRQLTQTKNISFGTPFSFYQPNTATTADTLQIKQEALQAQIMAATQFEEVSKLSVFIQKLNFLAIKNSSIVYTISISQISAKHRSQPYVQRYFFSINRFIIVDTSEEAGPQPIIVDIQKDPSTKGYPLEGYFTTYKSQIMKFKQKKSAYFVLLMEAPQIYFLKKKVLQLVNFLMITLRQVGVLPEPQQQMASKPKTPSNDPPLCYSITIKNPKIRLFRSSLSKQGFKAIAGSIEVNNFKRSYTSQEEVQKQAQDLQNSILRGLEEEQENYFAEESFHEMKNQKGNEQIQFQSFSKQKDGKSLEVIQKIYIDINQFIIFGVEYWEKQFKQLWQMDAIQPMLYIPLINIQFFSPNMAVSIPRLAGNMGDEDYRTLIRMTEQNLSQSPLLFVDNPRVQAAIKVSFRTTFMVNQISLAINILQENLNKYSQRLRKKIFVNLTELSGKNQLYTNNQILTQLSIHSLDLCTENNITIVQRLHEQVLKDMPQIPKSNAYTDIIQYPQFSTMEKTTRRQLNKLLQKQGQRIEIFGEGTLQDYIIQNQGSSKQKTNFDKISKWVKGMVKKCCKGCKCCKKTSSEQGEDMVQKILGFHAQNHDKQQYQMAKIELIDNRYKDKAAPMIYRIQEVLDFQHQINWAQIQKKKKQINMIYLNFVIRPNGEKQMYMQAKKIQVLLQNTKGLLGLAQFFGRPYSISDIPENVRKYKFNNSKPFKMLIQVDDTLAQIQAKNQQGETQKICVLCDLIYDSQARGDSTIGPGLTKMRVESVAKILFMSEHFKYPIDLSDSFKAIYLSENRIPYGEDQRNQSIQQILLKPHERRDWNISFFIPAFALKAISRIVLNNFSKIQSQDEQKANIGKQQLRKMEQQANMETGVKTRTVQRTISHAGQTINRQQKKSNPKISKKASDGLANEMETQKDEANDMIKQHRRKQMNQPPPPQTTKQSHMIRLMYITEITFQIQSKLQSSFIKSKMKDVQYAQLFMNNKDNKIDTRNIASVLDVNYWNLKLGVYEPCVEPWPFRVQQIVNQRDNLSSSNFKVLSNVDNWQKIQGDYVNDLNVNITIPLYQIYKELMIVYEQENYDDNEDCYDLTAIEKADYDSLFGRIKKYSSIPGKKLKVFPKKLVKYFTRIFKHDNQNLKKYLTSVSKNFFNPPSLRLYLYHSYFDHFRRKKCITYRTPYRIFNATNVDLVLWFYDPKNNEKWRVIIKMYQYYAIPQKIYMNDFLVHFTDQLDEPPKECPYVSVKYLIQMKAKKKSFKKIDQQSVIWKNIFKYSSVQTQKFVDPRDLVIKIGNKCFAAISVFSKHQPKEQQTGDQSHIDDLKFYDAYCILQSPIIIDNYTYLDFDIKVDRKNVIKIPKNERVQINQPLSQVVSGTLIQFGNDSLHEERRIFKQKIGNTSKLMEIQKLQSVKMIITRETTSSCLIKIYTEWNISNLTQQSFSLKNSEKIFLIDQMSFSCLSNIALKGIDICLLNEQKHSKKIKPNNIADVITLAKKRDAPNLQEIIRAKKQFKKSKFCGCFGGSSKVFEHIDFVINSTQDPMDPLISQKIQIRYRYQIFNKTSSLIKLCQFSNKFVIASLPPYNSKQVTKPIYIFHYDFVPQQFFFEIDVFEVESNKMKTLKSCSFYLDQFPGSTFVIKIKKDNNNIQRQQYEHRFYYFHLDIKKNEQQSLIQIKSADFNDFPIYIDNVTDYQIKITQGQDQFIVKPQHRVPFAWSHLISNDYKLQASIEGVDSKQTYLFNNKSAFEPMKIVDKNKKRRKRAQNLYLKQFCHVEYQYMGISAVCLVILDLFDNKLRIHNKQQNINSQFSMSDVQKLEPLASKIQIHFGSSDVLEIAPPSKVIKLWVKKIQDCVNQDVIDKIFFTIESENNSRIFFFRTIGQQEYESSRQQYSISHLNVSLISAQPEEIILLYCGDISYIQHDKKNKLNYKNLELSESQKTITLKKIKVSNQTRDAINPVVLSRIKKSNYPFLQLRLIQQKLHLEARQKDKLTAEKQLQIKEQEEQITHYKQITFFMDQAQAMVEAGLFLKIFALKKNFDDITNQYAVGSKLSQKDAQMVMANIVNDLASQNRISQSYKKPVKLVNVEEEASQQKKNPQVYINYLEIKPLKITASVYLGHNEEEDIQMNLITVLRYIPFGIENAIIQIQSYQFFHVFYDMQQLKKQLIKFYTKQAWNQIYKNAGSYDMLLPIQFIGGVGNGVKKIFYDPIYQLVRKKQIKAVGKSFAQGLLSFIAFLVNFLLKIVNLVFKILALFTFDQQYRTKRESFRKQIFKSPVQGAILGAKNFWSVFKSFFVNFTLIKKNWSGYSVFGYFVGFIVCILQIVPWLVKLVVSFYDWFYVICLGVVNWGYYEQSAMKSRSRPRRIFYHKQIIPYNYLLSLGNQIIRQNQLQQIQNQQIFFVKSIEGGDDNSHLILSNYRIIHNYYKTTAMHQIKLYQLSEVESRFKSKKREYRLYIRLSIPYISKILFLFSYNISSYKLNFMDRADIVAFLKYLKHLSLHQKLNIKFFDDPDIQHQFTKNEYMIMEIVDQQLKNLQQKKIQQDDDVTRERDRWSNFKKQQPSKKN